MTSQQSEQYERMTKEPIPKLVLTLAVPTIISMLITNVYNMADTYFVSSIGTSASGAIGVVFALMAIIQAFGFMFGHGAGSNISQLLGKKDMEGARVFSATGFYCSLVSGLMITILGLTFQTPLMRLLGSTDSILPYAREYSTYILIAAPAMTAGCVMNNILRYEGKATFAMFGLTSGGILNIIGDYVFIRFFRMEVTGAGLSTAISQYISMGILLIPFLRKQVQSSLSRKYLINTGRIIGRIVAVGMPSMMRQGLNSVSVMFLNQCAALYGDAAIAAMSITSRIINFMFCISIGIGQGFQPVSAFNYGAKKYSRVKASCLFMGAASLIVMAIAALIGYSFAAPLIGLFRDDEEVIKIGATALRFQCISLVLMPVSLCGNMLFQSIGKGGRGTFLSSIRSGLVFIPVILTASHYLGILGIQIAQPVSDFVAALVTILFLWHFFMHLPEDVPENPYN